ncbi:hypothetical protein PAAG_11352 [Paracoccidioides lutzii Pb01]|uniref:Uncharacterized protein n=1 Tax=Paracoccidioides lutzii (strain ATCC MYA-826 / Pb01) TaxID=502779 RepID=A0A0A2VM64_PARBA|nr:hypothetical protein PAAG_11352 [Paracoccidioides lutzii Pb01]KGQ01959.1 hypothetical protein PAAG_11352 [Paracoccidioides lutzii Pb01]
MSRKKSLFAFPWPSCCKAFLILWNSHHASRSHDGLTTYFIRTGSLTISHPDDETKARDFWTRFRNRCSWWESARSLDPAPGIISGDKVLGHEDEEIVRNSSRATSEARTSAIAGLRNASLSKL